MSAVEPPSSSTAAAPAPREFHYFDVTFYFSLISFVYDEGVLNRRGVDLSLVVTLYGVYVLIFRTEPHVASHRTTHTELR